MLEARQNEAAAQTHREHAQEVPPTAHTHSLEDVQGKNPGHPFDAGVRARELVQERAKRSFLKKVWGWVKWTVIGLLLVTLAAVGATGYYGYDKQTRSYVSNDRTCELKINPDSKNEWSITGKRTYSFPERSIFGVSYHLKSEVETRTQIDVQGKAMVIVGLQEDGKWKAITIGTGEHGIAILPKGKTYIFTVDGKEAAVVSSASFCK